MGNDTDEGQVIIKVQDGNDPPVFSHTEYLISVPEETPPGNIIILVWSRNSQYSFYIVSGNSEEILELDRVTVEDINDSPPGDQQGDECARERPAQHPGGQAPVHRPRPPPQHSALHLLLLRGSRQQALQHRPEQRLDRESGVISPRLKVEASYLLTVVVEDKKNNLSVGRPIYLTV